jgi:hypothetical protein
MSDFDLPTEPWALSSAGEHYVDIVGVAGSIPAAPTTPPRRNSEVWPRGRGGGCLAEGVAWYDAPE